MEATKTPLELAQDAQRKAEEAAQAARNLADAKEVEMLDKITNVKQINEGRTPREAARLKTRYITTFGLPRWSTLVANSR